MSKLIVFNIVNIRKVSVNMNVYGKVLILKPSYS